MDVRRPSYDDVDGITSTPTIDVDTGFLVTGLEPDEPIFVFRARDASAMFALNHYRMTTEGLFADERALSLDADVQAFIDWRRANQAIVRDPD